MSVQQASLPAWVSVGTGGLGGIFGWIWIHPVYACSLRLNLAGLQNPGQKLSLPSLVSKIRNEEGILSLYNSLPAGIVRQVFYASSRLGFFQIFKDAWATHSEMDFTSRMCLASLAGGLAAYIACPCEISLVRMSTDAALPIAERRNYRGIMDCAIRIAKEEGLSTFWRGCRPFVCRCCVVGATQVGTYDQFKSLFSTWGINGSSNVALSSMTAGLVYTTIAMPFESAKNRMASQKPSANGELPYRSTFQTIAKVVSSEGPKKLYSGLVPYILFCGSHTVLTFSAMEELQRMYRAKISR